jgi:hypothetical protein
MTMNAATWLVALAALGVQYSYRTGLDRQPEYILQIEPEVLPALVAGEQIYSEIPADVGPFARLCLIILPPDGTPAKHTASAEEQFRQLLVSSARYAARDRGSLASDLPPAILWPGRGTGMPEAHYGVSTGWQPDATGQQQFLVQLDPVLVGTLSSGDELYIPIDPAAGRLARFIVKVGKENLPRISQPPQVALDPTRQPAGDLRTGRATAPVGVGGSPWPSNPAVTDGGTSSRFNQPPRDPTSRDLSPSQTGWATAGTSTRFGTNEPAVGRPTEQAVAVGGPVAGEMVSRDYVPPTGAPGGLPAPDMWAPPTASVGPPNAYGPGGAPLAGGVAPRGYGPVAGDPRGAGYPDLRTAALPGTAAPAANTAPAMPPPPASGAPSAQAFAGTPNAPPGNVAVGLPAGGGPAPAAPAQGAAPQAAANEPERPWGLLLFVTFALFFSIGGNLYLAYTALEYHNRYRSALERLRAAARGN